jgi:hypothetical protein
MTEKGRVHTKKRPKKWLKLNDKALELFLFSNSLPQMQRIIFSLRNATGN